MSINPLDSPMRKIDASIPNNDNFVRQFGALYSLFKGIGSNEKVHFNLSSVHWLCPIIILPIVAHIRKTESTYTQSKDDPTIAYLNTIHFPKGINAVTTFQRAVQKKKTYIPISVLERDKGAERENLEAMFSELIYKQLGSVPGAQNAVYYPIAELVTNIFEHSKDNRGFVFGQYYPSKEYLDICIVDTGRGLAKAYKDEMDLVLNDEQAIIEVLKGQSTKSQQERGYGIRSSKKVICDGLGGQFVMLSGSVALVSSPSSEKLVSLPGFYWQGVIVAYRIPKPKGSIDISKYWE